MYVNCNSDAVDLLRLKVFVGDKCYQQYNDPQKNVVGSRMNELFLLNRCDKPGYEPCESDADKNQDECYTEHAKFIYRLHARAVI